MKLLVFSTLVTAVVSGRTGHPNSGAFEGGPTGTKEDTKINNRIQADDQLDNGEFDIPSSGPASPLFGAEPWAMKLLRFEEFGRRDVDFEKDDTVSRTLPIPETTESYPDSEELDEYLIGDLEPLPTEYSNERNLQNPWKALIEQYLGRNMTHPPMEGRPYGNNWKHQRWEEFLPAKFYQTATTGARKNRGLRTSLQSHGYSDGTEFGGKVGSTRSGPSCDEVEGETVRRINNDKCKVTEFDDPIEIVARKKTHVTFNVSQVWSDRDKCNKKYFDHVDLITTMFTDANGDVQCEHRRHLHCEDSYIMTVPCSNGTAVVSLYVNDFYYLGQTDKAKMEPECPEIAPVCNSKKYCHFEYILSCDPCETLASPSRELEEDDSAEDVGLYADQTLEGVEVRFHPSMPLQKPNSLWTFDGTFPPKLAKARYGEPLMMRHHNALPVDVTANNGFGVHVLTTHEHNGHNPAESDGYTNAFFFPGQYYDYRWPIVLAGHDSYNPSATDRRAGAPDGNGGIKKVPGDWRETMSTHWMHDHTLDFTAANVYKGDAAMLNIYSALDRGNEAIDDGVNLRLPSGTFLDWGNRDYDVNLMLADKAWDEDGQLWFNPHDVMGFIGDQLLTNWCYKPTFDVRARRYRFRFLNASVSRFFKIALVTEDGTPVPMYMVANDGNIMEHSVKFDGVLPTIGVAERYDIIVDFAQYSPGDKLYFVNMMEHKNGISTEDTIPLKDILDGSYHEGLFNSDGTYMADPVVGKFMQIVVRKYTGTDLSMNPEDYVEGGKVMIPIRRPDTDELNFATHRSFELERTPGAIAPWGVGTDGGKALPMDPQRVSAAVQKNANRMECWRLINSGTWAHPYHIHFEEALILLKDGVPPPPHEKYARKDVFRMGPDEDSATLIQLGYRFRDFNATFMGHCHNTQHEDHAMLMRWDVENPGQIDFQPTPIPRFDGGKLVESYGLPTARSGDAVGIVGPRLDPVKIWVKNTTIGDFDLADVKIGDALNPTEDERGWMDYPLRKGKCRGRTVWFVLHDISVQEIADEFGVAFAGALHDAPTAGLGEDATYDPDTDLWVFGGDLPNPVKPVPSMIPDEGIPEVYENNTYSPYRRVVINDQVVVINAFFVKWGDEPYEQLRIDENCVFPDDPPNTNCMYQGTVWGETTGHFLGFPKYHDTNDPAVGRFKIHKSWAAAGDYIPYYIVIDSYPLGTANAMGVIYVPRHKFLGTAAVALVQFLPGYKLHESYPPTPEDGYGIMGGGPLGGQIGIPSYFMPGHDYSPAWHIGFAHWNHKATEVVKSLQRVQDLREYGDLTIHEFPAALDVGRDDYDFHNPNPPHVVNCPTSLTIDTVVHLARAIETERDSL